jgi:leucyl/phenylalanyl-tRNA--protein transferase
MVFRLDINSMDFPSTQYAEADGLLAVGGDLSTERLQQDYAKGIFPWYSDGEPILWYSPAMRCVFMPNQVKISKSMQRLIRSKTYYITHNESFKAVIEHCATIKRDGQEGTWIGKDMMKAYITLYQQGIAHSIEVRNQQGNLCGGLYGVQQGRVFCGESMFSLEPNTSKLALIHLCSLPQYQLIDCQVSNPHLLRMGAILMERTTFERYL